MTPELATTHNPSVWWKLYRKVVLRCGLCKPHHWENATRQERPDKYKSRRRGRI